MIEKAENKVISQAPRTKSEERRLAAQNEAGEEWYFSADGDRPPTTIRAKSFEEAVAEYNRRYALTNS
ncbi:MAG: hypothetical protein ABIO72_05915 [Patescibacteria group bacterium]